MAGSEAEEHLALLDAAFRDSGRPAPGCADRLAAFLDELAMWSTRAALTGLRTARSRVEDGIMDCVPLAGILPPGARLVDVGSGNGLPGLVVAVMRPDVRVVLLEPSARRTAFLRAASSAASADCEIVRERVEDWRPEPFDVAVSRAVFPVPRWLDLARPLVRPGGSVVAMIAGDDLPEPPVGLRLDVTESYVLPWSARRRSLAVFERVRP
ncbi:MAG: class I SAM-dependent methyltransferase [Deltaproteobacteria bacterium]|nr:class I SAM-dependent methyltransferase [Deltaproteobacteria bacterium]